MKVLVLGIGSVLMGDDAVGPTVARRLDAAWEMADGVLLLDAGTPGPELAHQLGGYDALVVIDAIRASDPPGSVRLYRRAQILAAPPATWRLSPHDPGLREALLSADFAGDGPPQALLVGVVPERVELGTELTATVAAALPAAEAAVLGELARLGVPARRREVPRAPDLWWRGPAPDSV